MSAFKKSTQRVLEEYMDKIKWSAPPTNSDVESAFALGTITTLYALKHETFLVAVDGRAIPVLTEARINEILSELGVQDDERIQRDT